MDTRCGSRYQCIVRETCETNSFAWFVQLAVGDVVLRLGGTVAKLSACAAILGGLSALAMTAPALAQDTRTAEMWAPGVGSWYTHRYTEAGRDPVELTFTFAREGVFEGRPVFFWEVSPALTGSWECDGGDTMLQDATNATFVACLRDGEPLATWLPNTGFLNWPLFVGKTWRATFEFHDLATGRGVHGTQSVRYEVESFERIELPLGVVDAFKIKSGATTWDGRSYAPDWGQTIWHSPDIFAMAKVSIWRSSKNVYGAYRATYELVDYHLEK